MIVGNDVYNNAKVNDAIIDSLAVNLTDGDVAPDISNREGTNTTGIAAIHDPNSKGGDTNGSQPAMMSYVNNSDEQMQPTLHTCHLWADYTDGWNGTNKKDGKAWSELKNDDYFSAAFWTKKTTVGGVSVPVPAHLASDSAFLTTYYSGLTFGN